MTTRTVRLPSAKTLTVDQARALAESAPKPLMGRQQWLADIEKAWEAGSPSPDTEVIIQAMRVGDAVFVALPGEVFVEIGLQIKARSGIEGLFTAAFCNDCQIGYVPTRSALDQGGYEVDDAPYYYGLFQLSCECEQIIITAALDAIDAVK